MAYWNHQGVIPRNKIMILIHHSLDLHHTFILESSDVNWNSLNEDQLFCWNSVVKKGSVPYD
jgi:hypothetical protein